MLVKNITSSFSNRVFLIALVIIVAFAFLLLPRTTRALRASGEASGDLAVISVTVLPGGLKTRRLSLSTAPPWAFMCRTGLTRLGA